MTGNPERGPVAAAQAEQPVLSRIEIVLADAAEHSAAAAPKLVAPDGEVIELPDSVFRLLRRLVPHLAHGRGVDIVLVEKELTLRKAADLLNVPPSYLATLLDQGEIPRAGTGARPRIRLVDLLIYKAHRDAQRREALREMTQVAQEMGFYE